ncbi:glycerophosphodiester phosphodiesterase family protein [Flavihumibacter stibioxidans]|uniref:glycerophosphodiester phosphodiesterase family protein n=1 Tax=Flavihumibacter stibioxidans TaxID=1834163 RepID=UPI0016504810|nr:glycerophosphodiester phosphodiesterase family protein [Flavihumibacter stibioxidans]
MKKFLFSVLLCSAILSLNAQLKTITDLPVILDNYLYTGNRVVANIIYGGEGVYEITEGKKLVEVKGNQIVLTEKGEKLISKKKRIAFSLATREANGAPAKTFILLADEFQKNPVVAHRGAWKHSGMPENSIGALKHAVKLGCAGSEFDVQMTSDDSLIINHDASYKGKNIESNSFSELAKTNLENGEPLPTLRQYLVAGMQQQGTKLVLEVKPSDKNRDRALLRARKIVELVHSMGAQAWIMYISFDYDILKEIRRIDPYAHLQFLNGNKSPLELKADKMDGLDYHFSVFRKNENWIREAIDNKLALNTWTVNDTPTLQYFLSQKFDFITTNEPELLFEEWKKATTTK